MSYRELSMIEVKEVLRRRDAGQGLREIARETGLDRKTVRRYVDAAVETAEDVAPEVRIQEVVQAVQVRAPQPRSEARERLEVHRELISSWLKPVDKGTRALSLTKAHVLLQRRGVDVTYTTLCRWAHDELGWRERKPTVRVDDPDPGQEAQADFGKMGMLFDPAQGRKRQLWCLIVTLTYSRMQFVWPTFEQTTEAVCAGLDAAWAFFGGIPARVLVDNASAMVTSASSTSPRINDAFADYAQARDFLACRRMPRTSIAAIIETCRPPEYAASGPNNLSPMGAHPRLGPMPGWQPVSSMNMASFASTVGWTFQKKAFLAALSSSVNRAAASAVFFLATTQARGGFAGWSNGERRPRETPH